MRPKKLYQVRQPTAIPIKLPTAGTVEVIRVLYVVSVKFREHSGQMPTQAVARNSKCCVGWQDLFTFEPVVIVLHRQDLTESKAFLYDLTVGPVDAIALPVSTFLFIKVLGTPKRQCVLFGRPISEKRCRKTSAVPYTLSRKSGVVIRTLINDFPI